MPSTRRCMSALYVSPLVGIMRLGHDGSCLGWCGVAFHVRFESRNLMGMRPSLFLAVHRCSVVIEPSVVGGGAKAVKID